GRRVANIMAAAIQEQTRVRDINSVAEPRPAGSDTASASSGFVVALPAGRGSVFRIFLHAFHIYVAHPADTAYDFSTSV
ncbi:MAG TPA: hypothetical protein VMR62_00420, partial [Bryobacteraceae bacterium]|nr:hypothetical protein [Bryobacteraceae bacterium]